MAGSLVDMKQAAPEDVPEAEAPEVTTPFTTTVSGPPPSEQSTAVAKDYSHLNSAECGTRTALTLRITFGQVPSAIKVWPGLDSRGLRGGATF